MFNYHNPFQLSHSFSFITILFNYNNLFQLSQSFSIIMTFFNHYNLFQSLYNLWHYFYENKPPHKFHHLTHIVYRQNMTEIFFQFHMFLIYNTTFRKNETSRIIVYPNLYFLLWTLFILCLIIFSLNKTFEFIKFSCNTYSFCCIILFIDNFLHRIHLWF